MSRRTVEVQSTSYSQQEKLIHSIALTLLGGSEIESASALSSLLNWSNPKIPYPPQSPPPKPTPILVQSMARFLTLHIDQWTKGPSVEPGLLTLTIINNLIFSQEKKVNIANAAIVAGCSEMMIILQRLSFHPISPLAVSAQNILISIARFCDVSKSVENPERFIEILCSLFKLADPEKDKQQIVIALNFLLLPNNCTLIIEQMGADLLIDRFAVIFAYPSRYIRDILLEVIYALVMTVPEIKEAVCRNETLLRTIVATCIPQFDPIDSKNTLPLSPCQKSCALLSELLDDSRVLQFAATFKIQFATAILKWKSAWLTDIAIKISNVTI
ncbi:hypothetical protein TVAG_454070 [Trichomonas vaginalis G3]|uniref:Uncharacterized protein n=1 Tax=Trichomonas vaginalis (strain ATCC PRA-98 / G3) TaxID=412133 RepID=A2DPY3_TRIV3|nr:hypothetical protein TVAGG3_0552570 [Trichomonas vaginalis G3]EAY17579.1 hypothetical protein TVAG_454070 [Trichomonas vaginalis G3]KAI5520623.1 hypothetical protein TVAGG3_0552570 [Trichomonas vaginalis G3]|eukprot:XP_001329714.1 hypothetical protein [Trichomonas vaginalis G3]